MILGSGHTAVGGLKMPQTLMLHKKYLMISPLNKYAPNEFPLNSHNSFVTIKKSFLFVFSFRDSTQFLSILIGWKFWVTNQNA